MDGVFWALWRTQIEGEVWRFPWLPQQRLEGILGINYTQYDNVTTRQGQHNNTTLLYIINRVRTLKNDQTGGGVEDMSAKRPIAPRRNRSYPWTHTHSHSLTHSHSHSHTHTALRWDWVKATAKGFVAIILKRPKDIWRIFEGYLRIFESTVLSCIVVYNCIASGMDYYYLSRLKVGWSRLNWGRIISSLKSSENVNKGIRNYFEKLKKRLRNCSRAR